MAYGLVMFYGCGLISMYGTTEVVKLESSIHPAKETLC